MGDVVRITNEQLKFAKGYEQTFSTEIFRIVNVTKRVPQPVYELSHLQGRPTEGQFYNYELDKVTVTHHTEFQIDKMVCTHTVLNNILSSGDDTTRPSILGWTLLIWREYDGSLLRDIANR